MKAVWREQVIAHSKDVRIIEGNVYFPPHSVSYKYLRPSKTHTECPHKGRASYYDVFFEEEVERDVAWFYPDPKDPWGDIKDYVAFQHGVEVVEDW